MVVKGLEGFIENNIPGILYKSNIRHLIQTELTSGGQSTAPPTIVLDSSAFGVTVLNYTGHTWPSQPGIYKAKVEKFVDDIISCGANLIVILRGPSFLSTKTWYFKRKYNFDKDRQFFQDIKIKNTSELTCGSLLGILNVCVRTAFASISRKHYKVYNACDFTHSEVAEIAAKQQNLAVIGQDSNYLIYEGVKFYVKTKSLDLTTLDCLIYDKNELIRYFELKGYHLPLFAVLCGNDNFNRELFLQGHNSLESQFRQIAEIVRPTSSNPYNHIEYFVKLINSTKVDYNSIKRMLDMYLSFPPNNVTKLKTKINKKMQIFADERLRACQWGCALYAIYTFKEFRSSHIDFFDPHMQPPILLLRNLRSKIYGILSDAHIAEYCFFEMVTEKQPITPKIVIPKKPKAHNPGLFRLFDKTCSNIYIKKCNLFYSSLSERLNASVVKIIPSELITPTLALHYIASEIEPQKILEKYEIETFLVVALLFHRNVQDRLLRKIENMVFEPNIRIIYLITLFLETCCHISMLNQACGLVIPQHKVCFSNFFDGVLFQFIYQKMEKNFAGEEFFDGDLFLEVLYSTLMEIILG